MTGIQRAHARWRLWARRHPATIIATLLIAAFSFWAWALYNEIQENQFQSCQRGNVIRTYLALDNNNRLERIATGLDDPETPDKAELAQERKERERFVPLLRPADCERLR